MGSEGTVPEGEDIDLRDYIEEIVVDVKRLDYTRVTEFLEGHINVVLRGAVQLRLLKHVIEAAGWDVPHGLPDVVARPVWDYLREAFEDIDGFDRRKPDDMDQKYWVWNVDPDKPVYGLVTNQTRPLPGYSDSESGNDVESIDEAQASIEVIADELREG